MLGIPTKRDTFDIDYTLSPRTHPANPELHPPVEAPAYLSKSADLTAAHARVAGAPDPGVGPSPAPSSPLPPYAAPVNPVIGDPEAYAVFW
jgi:hypothetical protein